MPINYRDGIKRPGSTTNWTPDQVKELMKCGQDPLYFAEKYFFVVHPVKGKQKINLYPFQKRMIKTFKDNQKTVVLSARQIGKTTCSSIFLLWYAIFNEDKFIAILANKQKTAVSIVNDIKIAYENLPDWMKPGVEEYNNLTIKFENGTEVQAAATSPDALRGQSVSLLFLDEFAFVPENMAEDFWRSNYPTLSTGGAVIIVSTPNGAAGKFYEVYTGAEKGENDFCPFKVEWNEHPDRDEDWKERTIKEFGKVAFAQEYGCVFRDSLINIWYNGIRYTFTVGELHEKGIKLINHS